MVAEHGQPQLKKQRMTSKLFDIPPEVIERIIYYLPDDYLEKCIDLPLIGDYALNRLYLVIEIRSPYSSSWEYARPRGYESFEGMEINTDRSSRFLMQVNKGGSNRVCRYKTWRVNDFVQFMQMQTKFRPKIVHFSSVDQLDWLYKHYPHILNQLPRIDVSFDRSTIGRFCDIPKEYIRKILDNKITDDFLVNLIKQGWGENVKVLELSGPSLENLPSLFPNLQRLRFVRIELSQSPLPPLPLSLEFLQLYTEDFDKLDVSYLENLKEIVFDCFNPLNRLDRFKFPLGIERIHVSGNTFEEIEINIESFDSIEQYTNLKELRIGNGELCEKTKVFSKRTSFPDSLQKLEINFFAECVHMEPEEPFATVAGNLCLPDNLRVLLLNTYQIYYNTASLIFPESLRVLSITSETRGMDEEWESNGYPQEDWSAAKFPSSLVDLSLSLGRIEGVTFPRSLQNMNLQADEPIKSINFLEFENLVQLKFGWLDMDEFIFKFPSSLKILELNGYWSLKKVKVEAPNLKSVQLKDTKFEYLDDSTFSLPDSVEQVSFNISDGFVGAAVNVFPSQMKELYLKRSHITSDTLKELHLRAYKNLVTLDLSHNKISRLDNNTFPLSLQYLRLDGNPISSFSSPNVFSELINLQKLSSESEHRGYGIRGYMDMTKYFESDQGNMLNFPSSLISLNLTNSILLKGMAEKLNFSMCSQLQELWLRGNKGMTDIQILVDQLKSSCPNMVELFLDRELKEHINEEGVNFLNFS
ncbi:uncharacterized protein J8A68_000943 [[Candida] subhashii]|uniref:Uncharacterized protein n=1 Tax=[Candida] subhashii TaxID=561895 RepID=A0A8J5QIY2_9ASCO|nr:uncharacterized protein J8A68_000943 [[Candida] subhashii]KAG7665541.1 hypothetical protein J8A68_000943 [[Candida] subhashii]